MPSTVTETVYLLATAEFGTFSTIWVLLKAVIVATVTDAPEVNVTVVAPPRGARNPEPVIVNCDPGVPDVGDRLVMTGILNTATWTVAVVEL